MRTEIAPLLIMTKLEQYDYAGATAIAAVMLVASFALLLGSTGSRPGAAPRGRSERHESRTQARRTGRLAATRVATGAPARRGAALGARPLIGAAARSSWPLPVCRWRPSSREAFAQGPGRLAARRRPSPTPCAAIRLTLLAAGIAVPLNAALRAGRRLGHRQVRLPRQERCSSPSSTCPSRVSPVIAGHVFVLLFGAQGLLGPWLLGARRQDRLRRARASCWPRSSSPSPSSPAS